MGVKSSYHLATLYLALKEYPLLRLLFQRRLELIQNFNVWSFAIELVDEVVYLDIGRCVVFKCGFHVRLIGIDT